MHFEKWRAVPYIVTIASKKKVENGLKSRKSSFLPMSRFGPFVDHVFGEAPTPPLCQHSRPQGPVTCSSTLAHKYYHSTLVRPSTLWCVKRTRSLRTLAATVGSLLPSPKGQMGLKRPQKGPKRVPKGPQRAPGRAIFGPF